MTGYGRVKQENELWEITVEIRSVNHRFLDLNIKVPRIYGYLEDLVTKQARAAISASPPTWPSSRGIWTP